MTRYIARALGTAALLSLTACGGQGANTAAPPDPASTTTSGDAARPTVDAAVVRGMTEYDYDPAETVIEAATVLPEAIEGTVVGWSDGRSTSESDTPEFEALSYTAVLKVRVTEKFLDGGETPPRFVYVEVPRGAANLVNGEVPDGQTPVVSSIEELTEAVPQGTKVLVFAQSAPTADDLTRTTPGLSVIEDGKGVPSDATLLSPGVQGLLFQDESGNFVSGLADGEDQWGWVPKTVPSSEGFEYLTEQLTEAE